MDVFNRILVSLVALMIGIVGSIIVLLLTGLLIPSDGPLKTLLALYQFWRFIALLRGNDANIGLLIGLIMALVGFGIVALEGITFWRARSGKDMRAYVVTRDTGGQLTVSQSMICDVAQHEAEQIAGVRQARPTVKSGQGGVRIFMRALLDVDADAPAVGQMLQSRIQEAVTQRIGLPVAEVQIAVLPAPVAPQARRRVE